MNAPTIAPDTTTIDLCPLPCAPRRAGSNEADRARRVSIVLLLLVATGLLDLACTLAYMRGPGMAELNPIARWIAAFGGAQLLTSFKLLSVVVCVSLLYALRRRRQAEIAAWIGFAVMTALCAHWARYNVESGRMLDTLNSAASDGLVVRLPD